MSALKNVFKPTSKSTSSSKNAAFYNKEKSRCLIDIATDPNPIVRIALAKSSHTPTKILSTMVEQETDKEVLRTILMNDKLPRKTVATFVNDPNDERVEWFEDDQELIEHFTK